MRRRVWRDFRVLTLTSREAELLRYLAAHPSRVVPRDELLEHVWGYTSAVVSRATDNVVRRLRGKIERDASRPDHILTAHGVGYRWEPVAAVRAPGEAAPREWVELGPVRFDLAGRRVERDGFLHPLSEIERNLMTALIDAGGAVVSRLDLARAAWGSERHVHGLSALVLRLRRKVEPDPTAPQVVVTEGSGYRAGTPRRPTRRRWLALADAPFPMADATWIEVVGGSDPDTLARHIAQALTAK